MNADDVRYQAEAYLSQHRRGGVDFYTLADSKDIGLDNRETIQTAIRDVEHQAQLINGRRTWKWA